MQKNVSEFFETHPEITEVHQAIGVLFISVKDAEAFVGGTTEVVKTIARDEVAEVIAPVEVVTAPVEEAIAPVAEATAPVEEVSAPVEEVAPVEEEAKKATSKNK